MIGGIITGEGKSCTPTVFRLAWRDNVKELFYKGKIKNSDLEMVVLLMLWLLIKEVCQQLRSAYAALFSENSLNYGSVKRLGARGFLVAM